MIHQSFHKQSFSEPLNRKFLTEKCDTPSVHCPTLTSNKFFDIRNFLKHRRAPLWSFPVLWDKNFWTENCDIRFSCINFSIPETFWNREGFLSEMFRYPEKKQFRGTILIPLLLLRLQISMVEFLSNTQRFPYKVFMLLSKKSSITKSWYHPLMHKLFHYPKLFKKQKCSSSKCFSIVRQNNFDRKQWYPYHSYEWKLSILEFFSIFSNTSLPCEFFCYCEEKPNLKLWSPHPLHEIFR